jgi:hypothetical protein
VREKVPFGLKRKLLVEALLWRSTFPILRIPHEGFFGSETDPKHPKFNIYIR